MVGLYLYLAHVVVDPRRVESLLGLATCVLILFANVSPMAELVSTLFSQLMGCRTSNLGIQKDDFALKWYLNSYKQYKPSMTVTWIYKSVKVCFVEHALYVGCSERNIMHSFLTKEIVRCFVILISQRWGIFNYLMTAIVCTLSCICKSQPKDANRGFTLIEHLLGFSKTLLKAIS